MTRWKEVSKQEYLDQFFEKDAVIRSEREHTYWLDRATRQPLARANGYMRGMEPDVFEVPVREVAA